MESVRDFWLWYSRFLESGRQDTAPWLCGLAALVCARGCGPTSNARLPEGVYAEPRAPAYSPRPLLPNWIYPRFRRRAPTSADAPRRRPFGGAGSLGVVGLPSVGKQERGSRTRVTAAVARSCRAVGSVARALEQAPARTAVGALGRRVGGTAGQPGHIRRPSSVVRSGAEASALPPPLPAQAIGMPARAARAPHRIRPPALTGHP
jgi:hypothetical protein